MKINNYPIKRLEVNPMKDNTIVIVDKLNEIIEEMNKIKEYLIEK